MPAKFPFQIIPLVALTLLQGCMLGPDYRPPAPTLPDQWHTRLPDHSSTPNDPAAQIIWWQSLQDPVLTDLLQLAIHNNPDLQTARSRLRQTRLQLGIVSADLFPSLGASASGTRQDMDAGSQTSYRAGLDARWELDIFGGTRRAREAAHAQAEASEADLQDVMVSLLAELALNYVDLRVYQARLANTGANLLNQQETLELAQWRAQSGLVTELDVEQAKYAAEQVRAQLPVLRNNLQKTRHRISVLAGQIPGTLDARLQQAGTLPALALPARLSLPAETLRQRPDVRRAERQLAAQTAQIGVTEAARYPSFSLSGFIGSDAASTGDLFQSGTQFSTLTGTIAAPLFNAGKLHRNVQVQEELQQQALLNYHKTVLTALEETENALSAYHQEQDHRQALERATEAARRASELARQQYEAGLADFQVVLSTQRAFLLLEDDLNLSNGQIVANTIRLYKAVAGGWSATPDAEPESHDH